MTSSLRASTTGSGGFIGTSDASGTLGVIADAGIVDASTTISAMNMPVGTTAQRPVSPATGASRYNTTLAQYEVYNGTSWVTGFQNITASYLVVAGGGGGGGYNGGGGGGAGGMITGSTPLATNVNYVVTVGAGGTAGTNGVNAGVGGNSAITNLSVTSLGGGYGCSGGPTTNNGGPGGSGGGGSGNNNGTGGAGTYGQGNPGGTGINSTYYSGGGGGGAGAVGGTGTANSSGGAGGVGLANSITGTSTYYAGGGGGAFNNGAGAAGGLGGGGTGGGTGAAAVAGTTNTGGGGGGGSTATYPNGAAGGSGVTILSYSGLQQFNSPVATYNYTGGYSVHTFPTSGTLTYSPTKLLYNSLRFRASNSAYLSRTNASAVTNNAVWTWSAWVKIGYWSSGNAAILFGNGVAGGANESSIKFVNNQLNVINYVSSSVKCRYITNAIYVDPSAWYHIVVSSNSLTGLKIYINDVQVTSFATAVAPDASAWALNTAATATNMGYLTSANYFDGYIAEVNFVDGQALTSKSFGAYNVTTGVWQPIAYTGTYGLNGFYTPFNDNSSVTALGLDYSGNRNNWTPNNFSLTAGSTYDYMLDSPTLTSATVGNYCVMNPLDNRGYTTMGFSNANLTVSNTGAGGTSYYPTIFPTTGSYYFEATVGTVTGNAFAIYFYGGTGGGYYSNGTKDYTTAYGATYTNGDVIGVAYNLSAGNITFYKNNVSQGTQTFALNGIFSLAITNSGDKWNINFGQQPFSYTPPSGYVRLNTYNLPTPTIIQSNKYFDINLWTGNATARSLLNNAGFQSDFGWIKSRSNALNSGLIDSVRGTSKLLISNATNAEQTLTDELTSFNTNGFSLGASANGYTNFNTYTYVGWFWQAGQGVTSTNTSGTITSTVSVNATAGFSIATFTANGTAGATIGHGLGVAPAFYMIKCRSNAPTDWMNYSQALGTGFMYLSLTNAYNSANNLTNGVAPTSSVITLGNSSNFNVNGYTNVVYSWAPVAGYSAFGSYTGNGSTLGPFVNTGFRVRYVLIKCSTAVGDWYIFDNARGINGAILGLITDNNQIETNYTSAVNLLSNGFSIGRTDAAWNSSGATYIYAAFADNPFKYGLAQ